jgi:Cadherin-like domain/Putative Ig domain
MAANDSASTDEDTVLTIDPATLLANDLDLDGDTLTITSVQGAVNGSVALVSGNVVFTPNANYNGPASFTYTVSDGNGGTSTATVNLTIGAVNDPLPSVENLDNNGSLILLSNPTPPLFPPSTGGSYSLLPFREPNLTWNSTEPYNASRLSLYGNLLDYDLYLTGSLRNQVIQELQNYSFSVPPGTFRHTNPNEQLEYEATQLDGSPLPSWLHFDPKDLKFSGVPPKGAMNTEVMVKASDHYGNEAFATFKVIVNKDRDYSDRGSHRLNIKRDQQPHHPAQRGAVMDQQAIVVGKLGFNEQLHSAGKLSRLLESRALLNSLSQL